MRMLANTIRMKCAEGSNEGIGEGLNIIVY